MRIRRLMSDLTPAAWVWLACSAVAWAQPAEPERGAKTEQPAENRSTLESRFRSAQRTVEFTKFSVFPLKYANAQEVEVVLRNLFTDRNRGGFPGSTTESVIADPRTNSLIVRAPEEIVQQFEQVIKTLDQPQPARPLKIFTLLHVSAEATREALMQVGGADLKLAFDGAGNRVIAQGDPETLEMVEALLLRLDEPPAQPAQEVQSPEAAEDVQVRIVWLVAGLKDAAAADPPRDLQNVVEELEKMGVTNLKTAAQVFVKSVPSMPFNVSGSAMLDEPCELEVGGSLTKRRSSPAKDSASSPQHVKPAPAQTLLEINVRARGAMDQRLADLQTTITAPEGHSVVLGVSPVGSLTSIFVVQLRR
jgi:hypothetical protein